MSAYLFIYIAFHTGDHHTDRVCLYSFETKTWVKLGIFPWDNIINHLMQVVPIHILYKLSVAWYTLFWEQMISLQYIPRNMHTVFAWLCFVVVIHWLNFPYPSGLHHWHCGNLTIAPVPAKQPWWIWINTSYEFIRNDCITTTKQSTTKSWAYFLGYTV